MRRPVWLSVRWWSSRSILAVSFCAFAAVFCILLGSNRYMADCVQQEAQAKDELASLIALGQQLADASDLLTNEVRAYAETEDITHLDNYWTEVLSTKQRDEVIQTLENAQLPDEEEALLAQAKRCSDLLIDTETRSMHLILAAAGQSAEDFPDEPLHRYVLRVMETPLSGADAALSAAGKRETARRILYDAAYEQAKHEIMSPIEQFRQKTSDRLTAEVARATAGRHTASGVQIFCLLCSLVLLAGLLWLLLRLYIVPLRRYTDALSDEIPDRVKLRVTPCGASEPYRFGQMFNRLRATLERELENRRAAEEKMRQARDEADSANRAKSEFLAQMSHELRTPLGAVTGYLYLLESTPLDPRQKRYCSSMYTSSETLMELINQILDFSKIEASALTFETVVFDPAALLCAVRDMLERSAQQKGLTLKLDIRGDLPKAVSGDPTRLRQVLINLIGNAVKFTEHGGVTITAEAVEKRKDRVTIVFSVADTGIGIRKEDQARIFEPFEQADSSVTRKYGGTGLGLVIARRIVEAAGSGTHELTLESTEGRGSTFRFAMDFAPAQSVLEPEREAVPRLDGEKTVLLVDDSEINLAMECELLHSFGLQVDTAAGAGEALRLAGQRVYDLVLLDIRMPDMDGYELARRLRRMESYRTVPLLALTADAVDGVRERTQDAGMNDCITKPVRPDRLYQVLRRYFALAVDAPETLATDRGGLFRRERALATLGGDRTQLAALCRRFLRAHSRSAEYIRLHLEHDRPANARALLHDLIGLAGNLGCDALSDASRVLLDEVHRGKADKLPQFTEVFDRTLEELRVFAEAQVEPAAKSAENSVGKLKKLVENYDFTALQWFEQQREDLRRTMPPEQFAQLSEALERYDFERAAKLLNEKGK